MALAFAQPSMPLPCWCPCAVLIASSQALLSWQFRMSFVALVGRMMHLQLPAITRRASAASARTVAVQTAALTAVIVAIASSCAAVCSGAATAAAGAAGVACHLGHQRCIADARPLLIPMYHVMCT